ncbi:MULTISPECIES: type VI secretion system ATPase TssH [unclassified Pseudomonas]|uniref:type VI secretion system ATPase TssH n=1 Tax=unclassified Pseudomonas TaxID=196821 RepID=UPI00128B10F8|nr:MULTISPECIES: type VI secretion system ATPase TssH [unclassified Pseudomonas]MPQ71082.1 type VI secretion system ATPase TssH [Pseudomonas sp. MWU12-2323]
MINIDLQQLVQALDADAKQHLETAAERCVSRNGNQILIEDLLLCFLDEPLGLFVRALQDGGIEPAEMAKALESKRECTESRNPTFAPELVQWLQDALLVAHLELGQSQIDQTALLLALLRNPLKYAGSQYQAFLAKLNAERLRDYALSTAPPKNQTTTTPGNSALDRFTRNLTQQARDGKLDPVLCRDNAIRQMIDILCRRRKSNPIIVGEAGVGKTALVEGLALRIVAKAVPQALGDVELLCLDLGLLQAGASIKGEFERRLQGVIDEVNASPKPIILFIDEAHTLIGSGNQAGTSDAANLLKPALARGELKTIAATTWAEYKKYFEKDPALARRFQPVHAHEPTVSEAVTILRGLAPLYEKSHGVYLRDDAVIAAAELSARYLTGRQLPDKAVDVLDTACARVRIGLASPPEALERLRTELSEGERRQEAMRRDMDSGLTVDTEAYEHLCTRLQTIKTEQSALEERWSAQCAQAQNVLTLREEYAAALSAHTESGDSLPSPLNGLEQQLRKAQSRLTDLQANERLVSHEVCPRLVAEVISQWTGVPLSQLAREHSELVATFGGELRQRVLGQEQAVEALDRAMRAAAAGLNPIDAPLGVFLLVGPSGVGKTETALALAETLYGGERFLTTINMSEFQEKHSVSRLIGSPPGYVGYGEGGMLTEAVRQKPYSVVLLDEVEKADPDVMNLFYQIFDKGVVNDGEGREINFRNTLILMTSNLASEQIIDMCEEGQRPSVEALEQAIRPTLSRHFKPALLARMRVVPYYPVTGEVLHELVKLKLAQLQQRLALRKLTFSHSETLVTHLAQRCIHSDSGARLIDHLIDRSLQPQIVDRILAALAQGNALKGVHATVDHQGAVVCEFA